MTDAPPDGLPRYRVLIRPDRTGPDDAAFRHRVGDALGLGYRLHGGPALTFDGDRVVVAQALGWPNEPAWGAPVLHIRPRPPGLARRDGPDRPRAGQPQSAVTPTPQRHRTNRRACRRHGLGACAGWSPRGTSSCGGSWGSPHCPPGSTSTGVHYRVHCRAHYRAHYRAHPCQPQPDGEPPAARLAPLLPAAPDGPVEPVDFRRAPSPAHPA